MIGALYSNMHITNEAWEIKKTFLGIPITLRIQSLSKKLEFYRLLKEVPIPVISMSTVIHRFLFLINASSKRVVHYDQM